MHQNMHRNTDFVRRSGKISSAAVVYDSSHDKFSETSPGCALVVIHPSSERPSGILPERFSRSVIVSAFHCAEGILS